jgi:TRAP-type C4-dicarboxylate transport system substrate-binding protein
MYAAAFKEKLEELSGGKVKVDIYDGASSATTPNTSQVSMGTRDEPSVHFRYRQLRA